MPPLDDYSVKTLSDIINAGVSSSLIYEGSVCSSFPCWNNGYCVEANSTSSSHDYFCMCPAPYTGTHCQDKVKDNCSSLICEAGFVCIQELSACLPLTNLTSLNGCHTNPCLNAGHCIMLTDHVQHCLCTSLYHGVLCETPNSADLIGHFSQSSSSWSVLQSLFLIALLILFFAGCVAFCYGGNLSCYLLIPDSRHRYSKWRDAPNDEFSWDPEESDDDDLNIGFFGKKPPQASPHSSNSPESLSKTESIEMKSRPMKISTTSETFVSYDPSILSPNQEAQRALLPSIS